MASRSVVHPDSSVIERRLRPVYDCLDNGNNKKALAEAEKVLKKQKDLQCAKVLKALALIRLQRQQESRAILDEVHNQGPVDDATLQAMTICYKELQRMDLLASSYELAVAKVPTNEEFHSHLFMAYVRLADYKKQQLTAMALYKLNPKNPYYFWSVMSLYMQAITETDSGIAQKMLLPLAEKKTKKYIDEGKVEAEAEIELYLMILNKQKKYDEMIQIMESPLGSLLPNHLDFLSRRKAQLYVAQSKWKLAFSAFKGLIENSPDQIEYFTEWYRVAFILDEEESSGHEKGYYIGQAVDLIRKFAERAIKMPADFGKLRGPLLAKIQLFYALQEKETKEPHLKRLRQLISEDSGELFSEIYTNFGHKQSCYYDMSYILKMYKNSYNDLASVIAKAKHLIGDDPLPEGSSLDDVIRFYNYCLLNYLSVEGLMDETARLELVLKLVAQYDNALSLGKDLLSSDLQPSDIFCVFITHLLAEEQVLDNNTLVLLITILERGLKNSPSNHIIKILLVNLYNTAGAVSCSNSLFELLDIKHIQLDTLGYLISTPMLCGGQYCLAVQFLSNALRFFTVNYKDTYEYLISCYKFGSFTKVEEIIELREKLSNSSQFCASTQERMIIELMESTSFDRTQSLLDEFDVQPDKDSTDWEKLSDNRDVQVLCVLGPKTEGQLEINRKFTFEAEKLWLKMRNLLIRIITCAHRHIQKTVISSEPDGATANGVNGQDETSLTDVFSSLLEKLKSLTEDFNSFEVDQRFMNTLLGPPTPRILSFRKQPHLKLLIQLLEALRKLLLTSKENQLTIESNLVDSYEEMVKAFQSQSEPLKTYSGAKVLIEEASNLLDTFNLSSVILGIAGSVIRRDVQSSKKTRKKKEILDNKAEITVVVAAFNSVIDKLAKNGKAASESLKNVVFTDISHKPGSKALLQNESGYLINDKDGMMKSVGERIQKSYTSSIVELCELFGAKVKYLDSLRI